CIIIWDGLDTTGALAPDAAYKFIARSRHIETNALYTYEPLDPPKLIVQIPKHPDTASFDVNDNLEIEYSINVSSMVIIEISDKNGEYVDRPVFWSPRAAGSNADIWNGRKGDEALVTESGEYPYVVVGFALPQNSTILAGGVPIVTIPHLQLVSLNAQLSETFNTTVSLSEPCFLDVSIINVDGSQYRSLIQNEYSSNLERQIEFTVTEELFPDPGFYSLKIEAIDSDGNRSKAAYINFAVIAPHVVTLNDNLYIAIPPSYQIQSIIQDGTTAMDDIQRFSEVGNLAFFAPIPDTSPGEHTFEITFLDKASSKTVILNKVIKFLGPLKLALENAVFNPANEETLTISYELKYDDTVGAAVFRTNADGSPVQINNASAIVRLLCDKCPISAGSQEISWDGKDNAGLLVPAGEYRIVVYAFTPGKEYSKVYIETADVTVEN
ncbi:MAG TPA: FlgD immunoglobulin-like domain containing protein, partial [bacterium]|nr:FlgD immunoglobulin-like domain containing protein [bacterium]